jgi:hypothetical protein
VELCYSKPVQRQEAEISKGGDQTTSSSTSSLPEFFQPYATDLLAKAKSVTEQPYQAYQGERLADFSTDTNAAFDMIRNNANAGTPGIDAGINAATGAAGYQANQIPGTDLTPYFNPYTENVLDVQKRRATQTFQEQQAGRDASAINAGAFGGDRRFVSDSLAQRDLNNQLQDIDATGLQAMFDRGTALFQNDETNRRLGAGLGLDAATTLGGLGQMKNDINLQNAEALSGVGAKTQQRQQAGLDLAYKDFTQQRDYPSQQLSLYSQLLSGTPVQANTSTTVTEPAPDFLSQLLGLAVGGAGIFDLLN